MITYMYVLYPGIILVVNQGCKTCIYIVCFMVQTLERAQHELQTTRPFVKYPNVYYLSYQSALAKVISVNRYSLYWRATKAR